MGSRSVVTTGRTHRRTLRRSIFALPLGLSSSDRSEPLRVGVFQFLVVLQPRYGHARRHEFVAQGLMHTIEWLRLPADAVFIGRGVVPMVLATGLTCRAMSANPPRPVGSRGG